MRLSLAMSLGLLGLLVLAPPAQSQAPAVRECLRFAELQPDISNEAAFRRALKTWIDRCKQAVEDDGGNARVKVSLAQALSADGQREQSIEQLRAAAAQNDAKALWLLYEAHKSYDRNDPDKPQLITRAEAETSLRKTAELGHPYSMWILAVLLNRGSTVKRDPAGAILWAERAMANPPKDTQRIDIQVRLGHFLAKSADPEQRARGVALLETLAPARGDAKAYLALALRSTDPMRARRLLEDGERSFPGHAIPALADMLIKGEGGPKDEKRALALLQGRRASDVAAVKAALGELMVEGRLVPRDVQEAANLIRREAQWTHEARLRVMQILSANPGVRIANPGGFLYEVVEAADLGEPGAMAALIDLKLSGHSQFGDKAGGCKLATRAATQGDTHAAARLKDCS